ncbi:MAG: SH3 domain-containing protein [Clostridia bacterium]|nr:SH3 domain-containing protein [Clostridia bacterium]
MKRKLSILLALVMILSLALPMMAGAETVSLAYKNGSLHLRKGPGTNYGSNGYVRDGDYITVLSKGSVWSKIETSAGRIGYIKNLYISGNGYNYADGTSYFGGSYTGYVVTKYSGSSVNLRAGASTSTASMGQLRSGTKIKILGENGNWYLIETASGTQGYMSKTYIKSSAGSSSSSATQYATVTGSVVNVRAGAGTQYVVKTALTRGTTVKVLEKTTSNWWKIQWGSYTGYMSANYLKMK